MENSKLKKVLAFHNNVELNSFGIFDFLNNDIILKIMLTLRLLNLKNFHHLV